MDRQGEWLAGDALAESLLRVLGVMGCDAAPILVESVARFEAWADANGKAGEEPRQSVGWLDTQLRGRSFRWAARSYTLWMLQRTLDVWRTLSGADRQRVREILTGTGWEPVLDYVPRHRLGKQSFRLALEPLGRRTAWPTPTSSSK